MNTNKLKKAEKKVEETARRVGTPFFTTAHEIWLAGLGAVSLARRETVRVVEEGNKFFERLVGEGEKLQRTLRKTAEEGVSEAGDRFEALTKRLPDLPNLPKMPRLDRDVLLRMMRRRQGATTVYHLVPDEDGWAVRREGSDIDITVHTGKKAALAAARGVAKAHEPSRLVVHRADGTIQTSYDYEAAA